MMENFKKGDMAEAVDIYGVWASCRVIESQYDFAVVTFLPWSQKWDRRITHKKYTKPLTKFSPREISIIAR